VSRASLVLVGDVGGTNCRFALYDLAAMPGLPLLTATYSSHDCASLPDGLARFQAEKGFRPVERWCIAVAGATDGQSGRLTNLSHWPALNGEVVTRLLTASGRFINDFASVAEAIPYLLPEDSVWLHEAQIDDASTKVVCGPGSGLGVAILKPMGEDVVVIESEGGHASFAPCTQQQVSLYNWLTRGGRRAGNEDVLSGRGLQKLFEFINDRELKIPPPRKTTVEAIKQFVVKHTDKDLAAVIGPLGVSGGDEACRAAVDLFCAILGAAAGDYALMGKATGGVYLAGGVIRGLIDYLPEHAGLLQAFLRKDPQSELMQKIPLLAVRSDPGLLGAAMYAAKRLA
jgi:glucokinase